jgi:lysozyme
MTEELIEHVKKFEGWVAHPYLCPAGFPTIGYGHRIDSMNHPDLTKEEGEALLRTDLEHYWAMALRLSPVLAMESPRRIAAITDFCYNVGGTRYSGSTLRTKVRSRNWIGAALQNGLWVYITLPSGEKVKSEWQIKRRKATSAWLKDG